MGDGKRPTQSQAHPQGASCKTKNHGFHQKLALDIKGGFLGDRLLTKEEVITLATLPSREVLLAKVIGGMQAPITTLVSRLSSPIQGLTNVIQARIKQMEEN